MKNGYLLITYYLLLITPFSPCVPFGNAKGEHGGEDVNRMLGYAKPTPNLLALSRHYSMLSCPKTSPQPILWQ
ncbi:MAG: hypothetical protein V7L11_02560 [Nostoc sp.]